MQHSAPDVQLWPFVLQIELQTFPEQVPEQHSAGC
jgi:hypothetical protein